MAKYRKIDPRIWNDSKFRDLSNEGKLVFLFILTHPHMTSLGAMRATLSGMACELGWKEKAFREAFQEAFAKGLLKVDANASFVGVPNFLKYNPPESPNVVKSWQKALDLVPECGLKDQLLQQVKDFTEGLGEGFRKALPKGFGKAFAKGMPYQEQEQEQEQEVEVRAPPIPQRLVAKRFSPPSLLEVVAYCKERRSRIDPKRFVDYYAAQGWKLANGRSMTDWKAAVRTWENSERQRQGGDDDYVRTANYVD